MDILQTPLHHTRKSVSSALSPVSCFSPTRIHGEIETFQESRLQPIETSNISKITTERVENSFSIDDIHAQETVEEIHLLQQGLSLYTARASYARKESERLMNLDWSLYLRYQNEAFRYEKITQETHNKIVELQSQLYKMKR